MQEEAREGGVSSRNSVVTISIELAIHPDWVTGRAVKHYQDRPCVQEPWRWIVSQKSNPLTISIQIDLKIGSGW